MQKSHLPFQLSSTHMQPCKLQPPWPHKHTHTPLQVSFPSLPSVPRTKTKPHPPTLTLWLSSRLAMRPSSNPPLLGTASGVPTLAIPSFTSTPTTMGSFLLNTHVGRICTDVCSSRQKRMDAAGQHQQWKLCQSTVLVLCMCTLPCTARDAPINRHSCENSTRLPLQRLLAATNAQMCHRCTPLD